MLGFLLLQPDSDRAHDERQSLRLNLLFLRPTYLRRRSAETEVAPNTALNLLAAMNSHQPTGAKNRGFASDIDERAVGKRREFETVRRIEDHLMVANLLSRLLLRPSDDVEALLFVIGHNVVR